MVRGVGTAMITPFRDGEVDYEALRRFVRFQIENDVHFLLVLGTTGEARAVNDDEREKIVSTVLEEVNRKEPVVVGAGTNSTEKTLKMIKNAEKLGADGVLLVTPYYNKPTQDGLYEHYKFISERTDLGIILYNVPGRTGVNMLPDTVVRIAEDLKNVVGLKEASGNMSQVDDVIFKAKSAREDFLVYSGNDDQAFHLMCSGGDGVISVVSNMVPKDISRMCELLFEGNLKEALEIHRKYFKLMKGLFIETNPIPVKAGLSLMGLIKNELRLPLIPAKESTVEKLKEIMKGCGLL
ncbi:MAG: 4-hydroxy-tetrahydrodipicolinate synthase [Thermotogae bacterium]|nr:MAG: 4-hydroxy-tetrahydrodipicolinate synthase [Thermotogota bacterium]